MPDSNEKKRSLKSIRAAVSRGRKSARDSDGQEVKTSAGRNTKSVSDATVERAQDVAARCGDVAGRFATKSKGLVGESIASIRQVVPWESVLPDEVVSTLSSSLMTSKALSAAAKQRLVAQLGPSLNSLPGKRMSVQAQTFATVQTLLANAEVSSTINSWLQGLASGTPSIYDRAMDATYNATRIGGSYHRMFDGSHTIPGAFQAVRGASPDDNVLQEAAGLLQALARDATTPRGLPLVNWNQDTFNGLADTMGSLGIPRDWLIDMVNYDAVELAGASIGIVALALNWNSEDVETFANLVSGMGLSAVVSANPLLLIVTIVALAKAFHTARKSGDWKEFADGLAKGGICTGAVLLVTSTVSGPAVVVLLTGICVGIVAHRATANVSMVEVVQFVIGQVSNAPTTMKDASESMSSHLRNLPRST